MYSEQAAYSLFGDGSYLDTVKTLALNKEDRRIQKRDNISAMDSKSFHRRVFILLS